MECYTIQMAQHRRINKETHCFIDTIVKTGEKWLAPLWEMVMGHKNQTVSNEEYATRYKALMVASIVEYPQKWEALFQETRPVVLACYCPTFNFCHRYLLVQLLAHYANLHNHPFNYLGELPNESDEPTA